MHRSKMQVPLLYNLHLHLYLRLTLRYLDRCFLPGSRVRCSMYNSGITIHHLVWLVINYFTYARTLNYSVLLPLCHIWNDVCISSRLANFGQACIGITGPMVTIGCSAVSATWFPPDQRTTATGFILGIMTVGGGIPLILGDTVIINTTHNVIRLKSL